MIFRKISIAAYCVFAIGFVMRVIAWSNTAVINPDGALFIHQAKAIYYGQTDSLFCALHFLSNLPILIAGSFWLFHDWIFAARFVSFIFGFGALIPLYFLFKRFFDDQTSVLGTLIFAVMPVFVGSSVDIIRDPISWFFTVLGLYCFVLALEGKTSSPLILSCLSFMMAAWARDEASLFIVFSILYLLATRQERKTRKIMCFILPAMGLLLVAFVFSSISKGHFTIDVGMGTALLDKIESPLAQYRILQQQLSETALHSRYDNFRFLLVEVKKNMWLIAFGSLLNRCLEAFFYPFFLVCLVGFGSALKTSAADQRVRYLAFIGIMFLIILYFHIFKTWYVEYRHICLFILTCGVFLCFGITSIIKFLSQKIYASRFIIYLCIAILITLTPLYKNILPRDSDKRVFKDIGEFVHNHEVGNEIIYIATSCSTFRIISFYANLNYPGAPCPEGSERNCWEFFTNDYDEFIQHLKKETIKYFLWTEKLWPTKKIDLFAPPYNSPLKELGQWSHPDTGKMILFEVR